MKTDLTQSQVKDVLVYNPETGAFTRICTGLEAGTTDVDGYRAISVAGSIYRAHRLAWLYANGQWPIGQIDHINGDRSDNSLKNLRDVAPAENSHNQRRPAAHNKSSTHIGVSWQPSRKKWMASIQVDGRTKYIGRFATEEEAASAYLVAKRIYHPTAPCV